MVEEGAKDIDVDHCIKRIVDAYYNNSGSIELSNENSLPSNEMVSLMSCPVAISNYACMLDEDIFDYGVLLY